jgi:hypothetical protein
VVFTVTVEKVKLADVVDDDGEEMCERLVVSSCSVVVEAETVPETIVVGGGMYVVSKDVLE